MKHFYNKLMLASVVLAGSLASCTDDNYDLSDVDTTSRIDVKDLTVPVNLQEIKMSSIIKPEPDGVIQVVNGEYCIVKKDRFESSDIKIDPVTLKCEPIESSHKLFDMPPYPGGLPSDAKITIPLHSDLSDFDANAAKVPECIKSIEEIGTYMNLTFTLSLNGFGAGNLKGFQIKGLKLVLPKNLKEVNTHGNGRYIAETGVFEVKDQYITGHTTDLTITCSRINLAASGIRFDYATHQISFHGSLGVTSGDAVVSAADLNNPNSIPSQINYTVDYNIDDVPVRTFTGGIDYDVPEFDIPQISLSDLPDVLSQEGTDITLVNPQIYLTLDNPLAVNKAKGSIGLEVIAVRDNQADRTFPMDSPLDIPALQNICYVLSPLADFTRAEGYENAKHHPYTDLGKVVSGKGLPGALKIEVVNPAIDTDRVVDLKIGEPVGRISGEYYLLAPLQLAETSRIIYSSTADGWGSEDLDKLTIETLSVSATVNMDVPVSMDFTMYPIDREGRRIDAEVSKVTVPANAKDFKLELSTTGVIRGLDGIEYTAEATPGEKAPALTENMNISITNLRAKVSGYYTTDF